jgi:hypothetical protein
MLCEVLQIKGKRDMMGLLLVWGGGDRSAAVFADVVSSTETTLHKIIHKDNEQHVGYVALLNYMETYHAACFSLNVSLSCRNTKLQ